MLATLCACGEDQPAQPRGAAPSSTPKVVDLDVPNQKPAAPVATSVAAPSELVLPDVTLTNQLGEPVRLRALLEGRIAVIQTMFTTCGTICPPMGANFGRLQALLEGADDVVLLSISVDPITDTPERLRAWGEKFGAGPGWTLLTGKSNDVAQTLKALRVFSAEREQHSSMVVIGHHDAGRWTRLDGLGEPTELLATIADIRRATAGGEPPAEGPVEGPAHHYFTDVELVDHHGRTQRLYSDLLRGKVVVINSFFTSCGGVCPPMIQRIAELQAPLSDELGDRLAFLSITVDPITDTPEALAAYAKKFGAGEGWLFLGGSKRNVDTALRKLGFAVDDREAHSNLLIVGNEPTGLWKKAFSMATPEDLLKVVRSVLDDQPPP